MTQGFDEWMNKKTPYGNVSIRQAYEAGAASRQAEIDDSENTRAVLYRENMDLRESNIELQKRLDMYEREGYKLVPVDELLRKVQNIRALNTGEYASDEIEENVCEIEAMIGVVE